VNWKKLTRNLHFAVYFDCVNATANDQKNRSNNGIAAAITNVEKELVIQSYL